MPATKAPYGVPATGATSGMPPTTGMPSAVTSSVDSGYPPTQHEEDIEQDGVASYTDHPTLDCFRVHTKGHHLYLRLRREAEV